MAREIWIIDDDQSIRWVLDKALSKAGFRVCTFTDAAEPELLLRQTRPDVLLTDIRMPGIDGLELLRRIQERHPDLPVIVMTAHSDLDSAVASLHGGAFEYLPKPFDLDEMVQVVQRACHNRLRQQAAEISGPTPEIIGAAPTMQEVFRAIGRLARSPITVMITGESGTGKELVARALHRHSPRAQAPFIALNMAAIPKDLLESELFGHEKGAFTGAQQRRIGRFEQADKGTLFLDEIGDMPAELQTRLLRVLSEGEFYPLGSHTTRKVDVRIIAATHQDLEGLVARGRFREDLYHRLNVIRIRMPPLRERREDIPLLLRHFLQRAAEELGVEPKTLTSEAEDYLTQLDWPGNVRQLENVCRWLTVMAPGNVVHRDDLPPELQGQMARKGTPQQTDGEWRLQLAQWAVHELREGRRDVAKRAIIDAERILIRTALEHTQGRRQDAARLLGYGRNTLTRKINELGLEPEETLPD